LYALVSIPGSVLVPSNSFKAAVICEGEIWSIFEISLYFFLLGRDGLFHCIIPAYLTIDVVIVTAVQ